MRLVFWIEIVKICKIASSNRRYYVLVHGYFSLICYRRNFQTGQSIGGRRYLDRFSSSHNRSIMEAERRRNFPSKTIRASSQSLSRPIVVAGKYDVFLSFDTVNAAFADSLYTNLNDAGVRTFRDCNNLGKGEDIIGPSPSETTLVKAAAAAAIKGNGEEIGGIRKKLKATRGKEEEIFCSDTTLLKAAIRSKGEDIDPETLKAIKESNVSIPIFTKNYVSSERCLRVISQMVDCRAPTGQITLPIFYDIRQRDLRRMYMDVFSNHMTNVNGRTPNEWQEVMDAIGYLIELDGWDDSRYPEIKYGKLFKQCCFT